MLNREGQKRKWLTVLQLALEMLAPQLLNRLHVALLVILAQLHLGGKRNLARVQFGLWIENTIVIHSIIESRKSNENSFSFLIQRSGAWSRFDVFECH